MSYNMMPPQAVIPPGQQIDPTADIVAKIQALLAGKPMVPPVPQGGTPMAPTPPVVSPPTLTPPVVTSPEDAVAAFMKANPYPTLKQVGTPINMPTPPPPRSVTPRDLPKEGKQAAWTALAGTILGALAGGGAGAVTGGASALGGARAGQEQVDQTRMQEEAQAQAAQQADYANKVALANHAQNEQDKQNTLNERQYGSDVGSWNAQERTAVNAQGRAEKLDLAKKNALREENARIDAKRKILADMSMQGATEEQQRAYHDNDPDLKNADGPNWQPVAVPKTKPQLSPEDRWDKRKEDLQKEAEGLLRRGQDDALPRYNQIMQAISPGAKPLTTLKEPMTDYQKGTLAQNAAELAQRKVEAAQSAATAAAREVDEKQRITDFQNRYKNPKPRDPVQFQRDIAAMVAMLPVEHRDKFDANKTVTFTKSEQDKYDLITQLITNAVKSQNAVPPPAKVNPPVVPPPTAASKVVPGTEKMPVPVQANAPQLQTNKPTPAPSTPVLMPNGPKPAQHRDVAAGTYAPKPVAIPVKAAAPKDYSKMTHAQLGALSPAEKKIAAKQIGGL